MSSTNGIVILDKPGGITSHRALQAVRRLFSGAKAGHSGTLDPMATGVLPICLGKATRVSEYITELPKCYRAEITLGAVTDTEDAEGRILEERPVPLFEKAEIVAALKHFAGPIEQLPPVYSAVKHRGKPLYHWARRGETPPRKSRPVEIYNISLDRYNRSGRPHLEVTVCCSRGTYIRTLAADLGERLGCGAYLSALKRLAVGPFTVEKAYNFAGLEKLADSDRLGEAVFRMDKALEQYQALILQPEIVEALSQGKKLPLTGILKIPVSNIIEGKLYRIYDPEGHFHALARIDSAEESMCLRTVKYLK